MTDQAARGDAALEARDFDTAIELYSAALKQIPNAATFLIKRSTAYQRLAKYDRALQDAEAAVRSAAARQTRELTAAAQLRRAIAFYGLHQFGNAAFVLDIADKLDSTEKLVAIWKNKIHGKLSKLPLDDSNAKVNVQELPELTGVAEDQVALEDDVKIPRTNPSTATQPTEGHKSSPSVATTVRTPAHKVRHDFYDKSDKVIIDVLAKGVAPDQTTVNIQESSVSVAFPAGDESSFKLQIDPLFAAVNPQISSFRVLKTKIEITLVKIDAGHRWPALEKSRQSGESEGKPIASGKDDRSERGPVYPTSSKSGPKDWDQIAKSFVKPRTSPTEEEKSNNSGREALYVDEYEDENGDPANAFFSRLYGNADPDTRRAMMKSYQESGGTALSTNWTEVSRGRVPVTPPEGMEERKYEQ